MVIGESNIVAVLVKIGKPPSASLHDLNPSLCRPSTLATVHRVDDFPRQILRKLILPRGRQCALTPYCFLNQATIARAKEVNALAGIGHGAGAPNAGSAPSSGSKKREHGNDVCHGTLQLMSCDGGQEAR
jgi:hypothetical protein